MANVQITKQGLVDDGIYGYEMESPYSWVRFGKDTNNVFIVYAVGTTQTERNKGHATYLLDVFFQLIKKAKGSVCIQSYTAAGEIYIKHIIEKLSQQYGVRIVNC
jgi:hypothetical protein